MKTTMNVLKKHLFWIVLFGIVLYLFVFFSVPFEPYQGIAAESSATGASSDETWKRGTFFSYLLLPDEYFASWIGPEGKISLVDRIPILLAALYCLAASTGFGLFFLTISRIGRRLALLEEWFFSMVIGLAIFSLFMLIVGCQGKLGGTGSIRGLTGFAVIVFGFFCSLRAYWEAYESQGGKPPRESPERKIRNWSIGKKLTLLGVLPVFTLLLILGGMIPSTDYDVLSYHLAGAKDFAESGRLEFLPYNVYANMPFGAEMFIVWGIALLGDPFRGAMVGKTIIALTTVLTALGVYSFGRRYFSETAGLVGMILYLTTPWILYVSTVGLIDSVVGMYSFFALYALCLTANIKKIDVETTDFSTDRNLTILFCATLTGIFAGAATACKYPTALFVVVPVGITIAFVSMKQTKSFPKSLLTIALFVLAITAFCGGWFVKNWFYTGNPVYPLCFSIFGDSTGSLTAEANVRWTEAHRPHGFGPVRFVSDFWRILLSSPWNAPLTIPFCFLAFFVVKNSKQKKIIWFLAAWCFFVLATWWFLTHRIDRFWIPILPTLSLLAGIGATWSTQKSWRISLGLLLGIAVVYGFLLGGAPAPGKANRFLASLESIRKDPNISTPWAVWFNEQAKNSMPKGKILLIGEAKAFLYDVPVLYSTCWNETPLKAIVESSEGKPENLINEFHRRGISTVLVDWGEIDRFRSPGNYGFSDFVQPEIFQKLVQDGVLKPFCPNEELQKTSTVVYRVVEPTSAFH